MNLSAIRALAFGLAITGPSLALAQAAAPPAPPPPGPATGHWGHGPMDHKPGARGSRHLKAIHDILGIKPDQEAAFQAYATALHPARPAPGGEGWPAGDHKWPDHAAMAAMTTPERLDMMAKRMDAREAKMRQHFERVATATKTFYAELTPEQKRIMDTLPELGGGMGHHWGHGNMGGKHGGPGPMGGPPPPATGA